MIPGPTSSLSSPPLTLIAVGCGRVFERFHLPALRHLPDWSLVGTVDTNPERLGWIATQVPNASRGTSLPRLLADLRPDAVLISTAPETHYPLASAALQGGAHVLVEKPMVLHPTEAESLVDLARSAGRQVRVGFNRRFRPGYAEMRDRLAGLNGAAVRSARFELFSDPRAWQSCSVHLQNDDTAEGVLHDLGSHQLDLLPWILGKPVIEARARYLERSIIRRSIRIDLRLVGGLLATCFTGHQPGYIERLDVEVDDEHWLAGPGGLVKARRLSPALGRSYLEARGILRALQLRVMRRPGDTLETFRQQFLDWARALRSDGDAAVGADGVAGARCVDLVEACRQSLALDGGWIEAQPARPVIGT